MSHAVRIELRNGSRRSFEYAEWNGDVLVCFDRVPLEISQGGAVARHPPMNARVVAIYSGREIDRVEWD